MANYNTDKNASGLDSIALADIASDDLFLIWDTSDTKLKSISKSTLFLKSSYLYLPYPAYGAAGTGWRNAIAGANYLNCNPIFVPADIDVTNMGLHWYSPGNGSFQYAGFYTLAKNLIGYVKLAKGGAAEALLSGAVVSPFTLTKGYYIFAAADDGVAANSLYALRSSGFIMGGFGAYRGTAANTITNGTMPLTLGTLNASNAVEWIPEIGLW